MYQIDDYWCNEARNFLPTTDKKVLITRLNGNYSYNYLKQFDLIASCTTGTDHIDNRDIPLIKLEGEFLKEVYATAEHTMALILSLVRRIPFAFDDVKQGNWDREKWQGTELHGKTLGVIGYGRVGHQVAMIAEGFGMNYIWCDITPWDYVPEDLLHYVVRKEFKQVLRDADIITVHVPLTEETKGMFGIEQFKLMKKSAYFINTSRALIVDPCALLEAVEGHIKGAAIDVMEGYSHSEMSDLNEHARFNDNLIITPHLGGQTKESREKTQLFIAGKIKEYIQDGTL